MDKLTPATLKHVQVSRDVAESMNQHYSDTQALRSGLKVLINGLCLQTEVNANHDNDLSMGDVLTLLGELQSKAEQINDFADVLTVGVSIAQPVTDKKAERNFAGELVGGEA